MASLISNATRIATAKESIGQSIINKGVEVSEDLKIEDYSSKIDLIKQGIEEGTYNIEVYVRIDNTLIGEGVEFNVVGTDGTNTTAISRSGGYVFLTLNYGVGYDLQPAEEAAYYAESHPLIYHLKDEGNYFATDYYFTSASGSDFEIKNCDYLFYRDGDVGGNWEDFDNIISKVKQPTSARYMYYQNSSSSSTLYISLDRIQKILNLDFSKCTNARYLLDIFRIRENGTLSAKLDFSSCTNLYGAFNGINYGSSSIVDCIFDFNGTTGNVTTFDYCFTYSRATTSTLKVLNFNMDKATSVSDVFVNAMYDTSLLQLTFNGSFGGLSTTSSLTLDLSKCVNFTSEALTEMLESISENTNGNTRIFKLPAALYETISEDLLLLAMEKGYELSA